MQEYPILPFSTWRPSNIKPPHPRVMMRIISTAVDRNKTMFQIAAVSMQPDSKN